MQYGLQRPQYGLRKLQYGLRNTYRDKKTNRKYGGGDYVVNISFMKKLPHPQNGGNNCKQNKQFSEDN